MLLTGIMSLFKIGGSYLKGRQNIEKEELNLKLVSLKTKVKIEEAKGRASVEMAQTEQEATFDLDKMAVKQMERDWKDDAFALFFFLILFGSFVPSMVQPIEDGLIVLNTMPDFIKYGMMLLFVHVFGFRNLLRLFLKKRGVIGEKQKF